MDFDRFARYFSLNKPKQSKPALIPTKNKHEIVDEFIDAMRSYMIRSDPNHRNCVCDNASQ